MVLRNKKITDEIIRVNHAGEYGAKRIYLGQLSVLKNDQEIQQMYEHELEHLEYFNEEIKNKRVRPTLLMPIWHNLGFALGWFTAKMSREAAMACTVAVEEVIEEHYIDQIEKLTNEKQEEVLLNKIKKFRDDELHHKSIGLDNGAELAHGYNLLKFAIKGITKTAIALSKKI